MVKFYVLQIKLGKITLDDVPTLWRSAVAAIVSESEGGVTNG